MKNKFGIISFLIALCGAAPAVLLAHHGSAIYDESKAVIVKGVVTEWVWANPHCLLEFDVKDDKGTSVHWTAEEKYCNRRPRVRPCLVHLAASIT